MAQTITPVVHGGSKRRWAGSVALHVLGAGLAAAAVGALLGGAGSLLGAPWGRVGMIVVVATALAYAAREILGVPVPIPELRRQVPEWWRGSFGPRVGAFLYGVALGPGFLTHLRHGTFVAAAAAAVALGDPVLGVVLLVPFGLARAMAVALVSADRTEPAASAAGERLERIGSGSLPRVTNAAALLGLALAAALTEWPSGSPAARVWPAALAAVFAWAALAKVLAWESWRESLPGYSLPGRVERLAERAVPVAEASVAALLLAGGIEAGSVLALVLLAAFSAALVRVRRRGKGTLPCGCFGGRTRRTVRWLLIRNVGLGLLALLALTRGSPLGLTPPTGTEGIPAALAIAGLGLLALLVRGAAGLRPGQEFRPGLEK